MVLIGVVLALAAGYLAGRVQTSMALGAFKGKLESDTAHYLEQLEERNQSYEAYRNRMESLQDQYRQSQQDVKLARGEIDQLNGFLAQAKQDFNDLREKSIKLRDRIDPLEVLNFDLRTEKAGLSAELEAGKQQLKELDRANQRLNERLQTALSEKGALQAEVYAKDREVLGLSNRLQDMQNRDESTELTLAQMRTTRDEMAQRLAKAEGQLQLTEELRQTLKGMAASAACEP